MDKREKEVPQEESIKVVIEFSPKTGAMKFTLPANELLAFGMLGAAQAQMAYRMKPKEQIQVIPATAMPGKGV